MSDPLSIGGWLCSNVIDSKVVDSHPRPRCFVAAEGEGGDNDPKGGDPEVTMGAPPPVMMGAPRGTREGWEGVRGMLADAAARAVRLLGRLQEAARAA
eukprot:1186229-Prorocentrum_minimum.AAC.2